MGRAESLARLQAVTAYNQQKDKENQEFAAQAREQLDRAAQMTFSGAGSGAEISPTPTTTRRWPSLMERATNRERMDEYLRTEPIYTKPSTYTTEQMRKNANAGASNFVGVQNWVNFNPALKPTATPQETPAYVSSSGWAHRAEEYGRQADAQKTGDWKAKQAEYDQKLWELEEQARNYSAAGMTDKYLETQAEINRVKAEKASHGESVGQLEAGQAEAEANAERAKATDWEIMIADQIKRTGKEDLMDKLLRISELAEQIDIYQTGNVAQNGMPLPASPAQKQAEAERLALYNELHAIYGDVVGTWVQYASRVRNRENAEARQREMAQMARDNPFWSSVLTVPVNMASGAGFLDIAGQKITKAVTGRDVPVDYNTRYMAANQITNTIRGTVGDMIDTYTKEHGWIGSDTQMGNLWSGAYQLGMSMADSAVAAFVVQNPVLLAGSAATSAMEDARQRGASDGQALVVGLIGGVLEGVMEKVPIDKLLNMTTDGARSIVKNIVSQAVTEGSEEFFTTLGNTAADLLVMRDKSQLATRKRELMAQGYTAQQAEEMAKAEWCNGLIADGIGGMISGGLFAGGNSLVQYTGNRLANPTNRQQTQTSPAAQQPQAAPATVSKNATVQQAVDTDRAAVDQAAQMTFAAAEPIAPETYRQTAAQILDEGIFESPKYGSALQQTGLSRADVRLALRSVSRGVMTASVDPNVQTVLRAIREVDSQPVSTPEMVEAAQEQPEAMLEVPVVKQEAPAVQEMPSAPVAAANSATTTQMPEAQPRAEQAVPPQTAQPEQPGIQAVGAAERGFTGPMGEWKGNATENVKDTEIPKYDKDGGVISDSAGTMFNMNVPKETKEQIEQFAYNGELSYFPDTNKRQIQRVHDEIAEKGFDAVFESALQQLQDGKRNANLSASAGVLAIQAANRGRHDMAATMIKEIRAMSTDLAKGLQLMSVYNKLTPQGRLMSWLKTVDAINAELSTKGKGNTLATVPTPTKQKTVETVQAIREEALQQMENLGEALAGSPNQADNTSGNAKKKPKTRSEESGAEFFPEFKAGETVLMEKSGQRVEIVRKNADGTYTVTFKADNGLPVSMNVLDRDLMPITKENSRGVAVEDWIKEIGVGVARAMENRITPKNDVQPISRIIKNDLVKFASNYVNKAKSTTVKRTAVDTLRDYLNNRAEYQEAWNEAKQYLTEKYGQDQPDALEDFMQGTIGYNAVGPDKVMFDAIASSAVEQELTGKRLQMRDYLGDRSGMVQEIAADLIGKVGADGADAQMIFDAVARYVNEEVSNQADRRSPDKQVSSDINAAVKEIGITFAQIIRSGADSKQTVIKQLADFMVQKYGISKQNAHSVAKHITKNFNDMVAEKSKAALERMVAPKTKKEQKTFNQTFRELANMGAFSDPKYSDAITKKLFGETVKLDNELMRQYLAAKTPEEIKAMEEQLKAKIGEQIPTNIWKALNQWRYFAMLGNVSTHKKNVISGVGNTVLLKLPKDILATAGEIVTDFVAKRVGDKAGIQRTKAVLNPFNKADQSRIATAFQDAKNVREQLMGAGKYQDGKSAIKDYTSAWKLNDPKTKVGQAVSTGLQFLEKIGPEANAKLLDLEDFMICAPNYAASLAGYMKANGLTQPNDAARKYAIQEALEVVGRDDNVVSNWVSKLGTGSTASKIAAAVTMPFKKTPANMFVRALEYNPIGSAALVVNDILDMRNNPDSTKNASTIINDVCKGLGGSAMLGLGIFLAKQGLLRGIGVGDEEEREMQRDAGALDFSLMFGDDEYYTINQFSPAVTAVLTGATLWEAVETYNQGAETPLTFEETLSVISGILDPVFETSPFSGLNDVIYTLQSNPDEGFGTILAELGINMVGNFAEQMIPSLVSRIANAMDPYARETYADKNSPVPGDIQRAAQGVARKTVGGRQDMALSVDEWGRVKDGGKGDNFWETLSAVTRTGTYSKGHKTAAQTEAERLYEEDSEHDIRLSPAQRYVNVKNEDGETERVDLTARQYNQYEIDRGQTYEGLVEDLSENEVYDGLSGDIQYKMMDNYAQTYADQTAKAALDIGFEPDGWVKDLEGKSQEEVIDAIIQKTLENADGYGDADLAAALSMTVEDGLSPDLARESAVQAQAYADAVYRYELGYADVPDWVETAMQMTTDQQREKYLAAVAAGNYAEATYGKKYDGLEQMLSEGQITDEVALLACSNSVQTAYRDACKGKGISAEQFIDVYGHAYSNGESAQERREAGLKYIEGLNVSSTTRAAMAKGLYEAIMEYIPKGSKLPTDWLLDNDADGMVYDQLTENQQIAYNTYIRGSGLEMADYIDVKGFKDVDGHNRDLVIGYIEANYQSREQRRALYLAMGYSSKTIPW